MHHSDYDAHAAMQAPLRYDVTLIDRGASCIIVANDPAARAVLRSILGCHWCPVPWRSVASTLKPLINLGFSIEYQ